MGHIALSYWLMTISFNEIIANSKILAKKIPKNKYKFVFGIPAGGLISAYIVANELNLEMLTVPEFKENREKNTADILIIDDLIDGGETIKKFNPKNKYDVGVVYRKKHSPKNLTK
jgi:adenine/guanine phosphoribosyltransferase-like PRPP-binding protein